MKTERPLPLVIAALARNAVRVEPLSSPWQRWAEWALGSSLTASLATLVLGVRGDLSTELVHSGFVIRVVTTLGLALAASAGAFLLSVPGRRRSTSGRWLPTLFAAVWGLSLWAELAGYGHPIIRLVATPPHSICVLLIVGLGAIPGVSLFVLLRRAAPLHHLRAGALAAVAALAVGALGTQFVCRISDPAHHLLWHFVPVLALSTIGIALGAALLDWQRRPSAALRRRRWF